MSDACFVIITQEDTGLVNVSAPMQYKALVYEILRDARTVIERTPPVKCFGLTRSLVIVMRMDGRVDVQAPIPEPSWCYQMLDAARLIVEEFDAPEQKVRPSGYADCLPA